MIDAVQTDWMEWQAGYICGALLMPKSAVIGLCREHIEANGIYGPVSLQSPGGSQIIQTIVKAFQVSQDAARVRLLKLGLATAAAETKNLFG